VCLPKCHAVVRSKRWLLLAHDVDRCVGKEATGAPSSPPREDLHGRGHGCVVRCQGEEINAGAAWGGLTEEGAVETFVCVDRLVDDKRPGLIRMDVDEIAWHLEGNGRGGGGEMWLWWRW
jgi:hypothetical protein